MYDKNDLNSERLAHFLKMQDDLFWECNSDFELIYVSESKKFMGCSLLGRRLTDIVKSSEGHAEDWAEFQQSLTSPQSISGVRLTFHNDTVCFAVNAHFSPLIEAGEFKGIRGVFRDISQILELEAREKQAEYRFQTLFEESPSYISITNSNDLAYFNVNPKFVAFHQKEKEDFVGQKNLAISDPKRLAILNEAAGLLRVDKKVSEKIVNVTRGDGEVRTLKSSVVLLPYEDQERLAVISTDITSEVELKEKNKTLNAILDSMLHGFTILDDNLDLVFCNSRFLELLDFPERLRKPGTNFAEFMRHNAKRGEYGPGDVEQQVQDRVDLASKLLPHKFDRVRAGGASLEVEGRYVPGVGFISTYTDITERVQAIKEIRESEKLLREVVESLPFSFSLWGQDGRRILGNSRFGKWYPNLNMHTNIGDKLEGLVRASIECGYLNPETEDVEAYIERRVEEALDPPENMMEIQKYGDRWLQVINKKFPSGSVAAIRIDVTDQHNRDEQLRQAQKMEAVGQLTGGVAHDFNNLLAIILGNAELLEEALGDPSSAMSGHLNAIMRSASRGAELTRHLLSFSRKIDLRPKVTNLNRNIEEMLVLLKSTLGESVDLVIEKQKGLWSCFVDPGQVENSLLNLCLNSRDAMPNGGTLIISTENSILKDQSFEHIEAPVSGEFVKFTVSDNGEGISPKDRTQIFEPFFTTKEVGKGSGLGLSMVFGFVRQSNGYVAVHSKIGLGTIFDIYLPRC